MKSFIYGEKNSIHIIDLTQTVTLIKKALVEVHKCISSWRKNFNCFDKKTSFRDSFESSRRNWAVLYVNYRWLGGMLTNWKTIQNSIKRLKKLEQDLSKEDIGFLQKKEILKLEKEKDKLKRSLGGIAEMKKVPNMLFVIDTNAESLAIKEAIKLNIPIAAVLDCQTQIQMVLIFLSLEMMMQEDRLIFIVNYSKRQLLTQKNI